MPLSTGAAASHAVPGPHHCKTEVTVEVTRWLTLRSRQRWP
jgi:hypothetical protein